MSIIKGIAISSVCDECWALDESGDYPMCRITGETRGYNFHVCAEQMNKSPLVELPDADEFVEKMRTEKIKCDKEVSHIDINNMCELIKKLGYGKAAKREE